MPLSLFCFFHPSLISHPPTPQFFCFVFHQPPLQGCAGLEREEGSYKTTTSSLSSHIMLCTGENKVQNIKQDWHFTVLSWNISSYLLVLATDISDKLYCFCSSQCISTISITPCVNTKTFGERSFSYSFKLLYWPICLEQFASNTPPHWFCLLF